MIKHKPTIIVGGSGSGKTEFAVNYALRLRADGYSPFLADLDIINPYFRARSLKDDFEKKGIRVISGYFDDQPNLDVPALSPSLQRCFSMQEDPSIIDAGGDAAGAVVLARYARFVADTPYNMWIAVNANRPQTTTLTDTITCLKDIENAGRLRITGIINTTHLLEETSLADIMKGDILARELSEQAGLPVIYTIVQETMLVELRDFKPAGELFPICLQVRPEWL
ncbi:hypothetical protein FACS1894130_09000 [Spirochaetia bacterium]|nr:hypothetical protein FACS1894130_09000 [Spirochaetia bacterium]